MNHEVTIHRNAKSLDKCDQIDCFSQSAKTMCICSNFLFKFFIVHLNHCFKKIKK